MDTDTHTHTGTTADMHPHQRPEPDGDPTAAQPSAPTNDRTRRNRRALLGAAVGVGATALVAPAASARSTVQGRTGPPGPTGATGPRGVTGAIGAPGATGGAVPTLTTVSTERFVSDGTGVYHAMSCPEPDMIAFSVGWKNLPPDWLAWRQYNTLDDKSRISVGFIDRSDSGPPNEGTVEIQLFCLRATLAPDQ